MVVSVRSSSLRSAHRRTSSRFLLGLMLAMASLLGACGSDGGAAGGDDAGLPDAAAVDSSDSVGADDSGGLGDAVDDVVVALNLDFRVAFSYQGRVQELLGQSDLWVMQADGSERVSVTDFVQAGEAGLSCQYACILDDGMTWLAVANGPRSPEGRFAFEMGRFDADGNVAMSKSAPLEGVVDLHFGGDYLYYSTLSREAAGSQQFQIWRVNLQRPAERDQLFLFPPDDAMEDSIYRGHFDVSASGNEVVLLSPTIRSQAVYAWRDGHLDQLDYICPAMQNGVCIGAGSEYSDVDPVAVSRDGRYIAAFVIAGQQLRVRLYDLNDLTSKPYKDLAMVPPGSTYRNTICEHLETWQRAEVVGKPLFTRDGSAILYVGSTKCGTVKPATDIMRIAVDRIVEQRPLDAEDIDNLTNFPRTDGPEQVAISHFDLSPDETVLVFSGTPAWQENGQPLTSAMSRQRKDSEVWVQGVSGAGLLQVTNDKKWAAVGPRSLPPAP